MKTLLVMLGAVMLYVVAASTPARADKVYCCYELVCPVGAICHYEQVCSPNPGCGGSSPTRFNAANLDKHDPLSWDWRKVADTTKKKAEKQDVFLPQPKVR